MQHTEVRYCYSELDKAHEYYVKSANDAFSSWVWFGIGSKLKRKSKLRLYPFVPSWKKTKVVYTAKINIASTQGINIANFINRHYLSKTKK